MSRSPFLSATFAALIALLNALPAHAQNWPNWRGPAGTSISTEKNLPTEWSREKGVRWKVDLPDRGNSTPVVWGNQVFLTQGDKEGLRSLMCVDRRSGKQLWQSGMKYKGTESTHKANPYCSPSPVTDGERVIVWYGSAGLFCFDMKGTEIWSRDLGPQKHIWGVGQSPILHGDLCILNFGPGVNEFIIAVNKKTGKTAWKVDRLPLDEELKLSGPANNGSVDPERDPADLGKKLRGSWATPMIVKSGDRDRHRSFGTSSMTSRMVATTASLVWASTSRTSRANRSGLLWA